MEARDPVVPPGEPSPRASEARALPAEQRRIVICLPFPRRADDDSSPQVDAGLIIALLRPGVERELHLVYGTFTQVTLTAADRLEVGVTGLFPDKPLSVRERVAHALFAALDRLPS